MFSTMDNGQWTMDNGQWTMDNGQLPRRKCRVGIAHLNSISSISNLKLGNFY